MRTLCLFFGLVSAAMSASITLSTTCASGNNTVLGAGSCGVKNSTGSAGAQSLATFIVSSNTVTVDAITSATASTGGNTATFGFAPFSASATVAITADLYTTGPVRQGYVEVSGGSQTGDGGDGGGNSSYSVGSAMSSFCPVNSSCYGTLGSRLVPIQLGTSFTFTETQSANGETDPTDFLGDGLANTSETFTFFEADGVTPVTVFDSSAVPEPATWPLFALGLAVFVAQTFPPAFRVKSRIQ